MVGVAAACDIVRDDAGLIAAIVMGLAVANLRVFHVPAQRPFFETLVQLIIGVLFVSTRAPSPPPRCGTSCCPPSPWCRRPRCW